MKSDARVSIIIPTGSRSAALTETLESIQQYAPGNEVIVVGNRDDYPTRIAIDKFFSFVKYLETDETSAVVKRNLGIAHATNEILVFVDDDVLVESTWLENLLRHYVDSSVGGVGGRVKVPGRDVGPSTFKTGTIEDGFVIGNWNPPATQAFEVEHLLGCNMSFRKTGLVKTGGFDNFFRAYNFREETDLCLRIRRLGYRILFDPDASLVHKAMGRKNQGSRWVYYYVRNTVYLYLMYHPRQGPSMPKFFHHLIFPPREYAELSGVNVRISHVTPIVAISGVIAGLLGYIGHR
jgi:GT2 family glycosyltransferase